MNTIVFENNLKKVLPIQGREYSRFLSVGKNLGREDPPCVVHLQFFPLHLWQGKNEKKKKKEKNRKKGRKENKNKKKGKNFSTQWEEVTYPSILRRKKNLFPSLVAFSLSPFHGGARVERIVTSNLENLPPAAAKTRRWNCVHGCKDEVLILQLQRGFTTGRRERVVAIIVLIVTIVRNNFLLPGNTIIDVSNFFFLFFLLHSSDENYSK